ncbi:PorH family porin [Corynebacterium sp. A21]|uniref:PorH family porin n=1 Tax=Corynebacterium sp. A21 TaxID=3457318 RepID=UPI003FCFECC9
MELDFAIDQLDTFSTFGENIGEALQTIPELLQTIISFFAGAEGNAETTSSILGSSADAEVEA